MPPSGANRVLRHWLCARWNRVRVVDERAVNCATASSGYSTAALSHSMTFLPCVARWSSRGSVPVWMCGVVSVRCSPALSGAAPSTLGALSSRDDKPRAEPR